MTRRAARKLVFETLAGEISKPVYPRPAVYFVGPAMYASNVDEERARVEAMCEGEGIDCLWPSERYLFQHDDPRAGGQVGIAAMIFNAAQDNIREATAIVADISPFRGPHMDPETAFQIGMAFTLWKPVFAWTRTTAGAANTAGNLPTVFDRGAPLGELAARIPAGDGLAAASHWRDELGYLIENLGLTDSAGIVCAIEPISPTLDEAFACAVDLIRAQQEFYPSERGC